MLLNPVRLALRICPYGFNSHNVNAKTMYTVDEEYAIKIAKRSCIDITDAMDMDFTTVVYNKRFSSREATKEQVCYWLLKCKERQWLKKRKMGL